MKRSILIVGAGPGLSRAVAEKFASAGFDVGLISRYPANVGKMIIDLEARGARVVSAAADAGNAKQLGDAIASISTALGDFDIVLYNAAVVKIGDIMDETPEDLIADFSVNVVGAIRSLQITFDGLKKKKGSFLLTGGGLAIRPAAAYGSLSIGKAGIRNLALQLHDRLKSDGIFVGLLTIDGLIDPDSQTHSPAALAGLFWKLYSEQSALEIHQ